MPLDNRFIRGADRLKTRIATIRERLNLTGMVDEMADLILKRTLDRFDREVDPDENPWPELAESTIKRKAREWPGEPKLVRTHDLRNAIKVIRGGVTGTTFFNTGAGRRIGIEDPRIAIYARMQNKGVPGRMPARRFMGIGAGDVKAVDNLLRRKARQIEDDDL